MINSVVVDIPSTISLGDVDELEGRRVGSNTGLD